MDDASSRRTRDIAMRHLAAGDALGWFDEVYAAAQEDMSAIPWADARPNPSLLQWLERGSSGGGGQGALVVGCGLGDDAEELSRRSFAVTAFDISPASIDWCRKRFHESSVDYRVADLFQAPAEWQARFDFIFEAYTLQSMPTELRLLAMESIARFLAPGGVLLVVARGRDPQEPDKGPPWPLTKAQLETFTDCGLILLSFEDCLEGDDRATRRFRAVYQKPQTEG
jgi:SAM-dependent methyltransferase